MAAEAAPTWPVDVEDSVVVPDERRRDVSQHAVSGPLAVHSLILTLEDLEQASECKTAPYVIGVLPPNGTAPLSFIIAKSNMPDGDTSFELSLIHLVLSAFCHLSLFFAALFLLCLTLHQVQHGQYYKSSIRQSRLTDAQIPWFNSSLLLSYISVYSILYVVLLYVSIFKEQSSDLDDSGSGMERTFYVLELLLSNATHFFLVCIVMQSFLNAIFKVYYTTRAAGISTILNYVVFLVMNLLLWVASFAIVLAYLIMQQFAMFSDNDVHRLVDVVVFFMLTSAGMFVILFSKVVMLFVSTDTLIVSVAAWMYSASRMVLYFIAFSNHAPSTTYLIVDSVCGVMYCLGVLYAVSLTKSCGIAPSLPDIIRDDVSLAYFRRFLQVERSDENLDFFMQVHRFRSRVTNALAWQIYSEFVADNAPRLVNVFDHARRQVTLCVKKLSEGTRASADMFRPMEIEVAQTLSFDSFKRFQSSSAYLLMEYDLYRRGMLKNETLLSRWSHGRVGSGESGMSLLAAV
ncbi:Regulator of G protein signaling domain [Carpediemonas membranifera]|uniref:Regulator of G protein signaling domain n=1 Tax=Carpediemonas membranifera TaxID=201153 RepID=A0A8J6AW04_9EUKA|nr:Regulator of G protein signaling domain [Carpediemonas membranifera]|eukprot:KAG9393890.1 Regulator of G protein signaling domain [Carpediemonas membranifera]